MRAKSCSTSRKVMNGHAGHGSRAGHEGHKGQRGQGGQRGHEGREESKRSGPKSKSGGPRSQDQDLSWRTLSEMRTPRFFIVYNPR